MERVEHILDELTARYDLKEPLRRRLRPLLQRILAPDVPEERRVFLLEMVAETCQRDQKIRTTFGLLKERLEQLSRSLERLAADLRAQGGDVRD